LAALSGCFFDTSVLIGGIVDIGSDGEASQAIMTAVADGIVERPSTAWHCCLEFYSVVTRLPIEYRLTPADAARLVEEELLARFAVHQLEARGRAGFVRAAAHEGIAGGRLYDAHIAEIARASGATTVVTDNPRHFAGLRGRGLVVATSREFAQAVSSA
jgi:predicted nucleic acid-binding protein